MSDVTFRSATTTDAAALVELYNHYVATSTVTFDLEPWTTTDMVHKIESVRALGMPFLVMEIDGDLVGYGYLSTFRAKAAYDATMENTVYLRHDARGMGLGRVLLDELVEQGRAAGVREIIACIASTPDAVPSIRLHERAGFVRVGEMDGVGRKFNEWIGVVFLQRSLSS